VSAISGRNETAEGPEWGSLLEWTWKFADANFAYGRLESVDRDLDELLHKRQRPAGEPRRRTRVEALTLGYVRNVPLLPNVETGIGADVTAYRFSSRLDASYDPHPVSLHVFGRVRFGSHGGGTGMHHHMHEE